MQDQYLLSETAAETTPSAVPLARASPNESLTTEVVQSLPTSQATANLVASIQHTIRRRKRCFQFTNAVFWGWGLTNLLTLVPAGREWSGNHMYFGWTVLMVLVAAVIVYSHVLFTPMKMDLNELQRAGGKRAIPILLDALIIQPSKAGSQCVGPLTLLLPQLQVTDAALLTSRHRRFLNSILKAAHPGSRPSTGGDEFILSLLKAYEQVGDKDAVPVVEHLANRKPRNKRQQQIQQAAEECLPLLYAHVSSLQSEQTLLRATTLDSSQSDILMRPVTTDASTDGDELLHAVENGE